MSREPKKLCEGPMYASKFEFWNFEILGFIFVKWTRCKIGVDALTQSARGRWPRAIFWQSHRAPMPLSKFFSMQQAAPMSLMRGLCWNHRFRPSCACVLPLVRDAGPLLEPLVPPLVRLRAGGPAGQCRTGGAHRTLWFLLSKKTWLLSTKKVVQV